MMSAMTAHRSPATDPKDTADQIVVTKDDTEHMYARLARTRAIRPTPHEKLCDSNRSPPPSRRMSRSRPLPRRCTFQPGRNRVPFRRFLPGSCPVPARFLRPPKRFLPNGVSKSRIVSFLYHIISSLQTRRTTRREQVARLFQDRGAGLSPCARNTIREAISRDTSSSQHAGHAARRNRTRSAAGTFSGHRQRSRRIRHQKCGCRLSPTTSGSSTPRDRACSSTSR